MAIHPNARICSYIKVNGIRCGSPALREEVFCYFHQRMIRGVRTPPNSRLHPIANFEDPQAIQSSLMEVVNALVRNHIDVSRAQLILRALHIAVKNAAKVHFHWSQTDMVSEVPEYPAAPPATGPFAMATTQAEALAHINTPQEEESETDRLDGIYSAPAETKQRKPPASIKKPTRARRPQIVGQRDERQSTADAVQMKRDGQACPERSRRECPPHTGWIVSPAES